MLADYTDTVCPFRSFPRCRRLYGMTKMMYIIVTSLSPLYLPGLLMKNSDAIPADIEKLHKDDIAATIARDVDALTALWDDDAVLLQPGIPPIVGKAAFFDFVKHALAKSPTVKVVKYVPDIRDIQVAGNVA